VRIENPRDPRRIRASGWWLFLTAAKSILSIALIALLLLAILGRFRRE
jgi:hypothetical protein